MTVTCQEVWHLLFPAICAKLRHVTEGTTWADRFKAARKTAGFASAKALAAHLGISERQAIRYETEEALPSPRVAARIALLSAELADMMAAIPREEERRHDLAARVAVLEQEVRSLRAELGRGRRRRGGESRG